MDSDPGMGILRQPQKTNPGFKVRPPAASEHGRKTPEQIKPGRKNRFRQKKPLARPDATRLRYNQGTF